MKNTQEINGALSIIKRLPSSANGNPRFLVNIGGIECRTAPDSGIAYGVQNVEGKNVAAVVATFYGYKTIISLK